MPSIITPKLKSFIEGPQGMALGTRDKNLKPEYCRVLGALVMENDIVKIFVAKLVSDQSIKNIDDNKLVSITLCNIFSYECYQFKGKCVHYEDGDNKGIQKEILRKIFDPFFTTKSIGSGVGLSLSISHGIIEKHGGTIEVESKLGKGSEFIINPPINKIPKLTKN